MQRNDFVYVGHMLDTARAVVARLAGRSRAESNANEDFRLALPQLIRVFGEAARRVFPAFPADAGAVAVAEDHRHAHQVVHDYLHVDYDIVWTVATRDLPPLAGVSNRSCRPTTRCADRNGRQDQPLVRRSE
jgi:uncharacterized protein with HEPN domain